MTYFASPRPELAVVQENLDRLRHCVLDCLRHKYPEQRMTVEFRHDVFKYLFQRKGRKSKDKYWTMYEEPDFSKCNFPIQWNSWFDKHGDGWQDEISCQDEDNACPIPQNSCQIGRNNCGIPKGLH
ncbi:hypothetical protein OS493_026113 [Desmophyllum pertusum]|uniref:Uncharacterized protein n=1 Tax=Desmophyllum pertusum TaxID=174260 RepID=A0A9X0CFJ5_9CNID|nr:hypothetical protein OS493_026113 [Desmophyllum pertusum]